MRERFTLDKERLVAALSQGANDGFACIDEFSGPAELAILIANLMRQGGIIESPEGLSISIYADADPGGDGVAVNVWSRACPAADVIGAVDDIATLVPRELWESGEDVTRTVEIVDTVLAHATRAIAAVRLLEREADRLFEPPAARPAARDDTRVGPLHKTTVVVWSRFPGEQVELEELAREATCGAAYCARYRSELVNDPERDPAWDRTDFFSEEEL